MCYVLIQALLFMSIVGYRTYWLKEEGRTVDMNPQSRRTFMSLVRMRVAVVSVNQQKHIFLKHVRERRSGFNWCQAEHGRVACKGAYIPLLITLFGR